MFFKDKFTEVYVPRAFKNDVADIEVHGKKVELIDMVQICQDRKIWTGYDLCPVPTTNFLSMSFSIDSPITVWRISQTLEVRHFFSNVPIIMVGNKYVRDDDIAKKELANMKQRPFMSMCKINIADQSLSLMPGHWRLWHLWKNLPCHCTLQISVFENYVAVVEVDGTMVEL